MYICLLYISLILGEKGKYFDNYPQIVTHYYSTLPAFTIKHILAEIHFS